MVEWKDVHSTSPAKTPKLQCIAEKSLTGEFWIPPEKDTPCPRAKKPRQDGRRGKITVRIKLHICQRYLEGSNQTCAHQETLQSLIQNCL